LKIWLSGVKSSLTNEQTAKCYIEMLILLYLNEIKYYACSYQNKKTR
jgi:hypothetical protein